MDTVMFPALVLQTGEKRHLVTHGKDLMTLKEFDRWRGNAPSDHGPTPLLIDTFVVVGLALLLLS